MTAASKWVDEAMSAASVATDAAWDAGKCEEYGAKLAAPNVELRDRKLEELRAHLTTQAALCEQLAEALECVTTQVDAYASREIARAALTAYEESQK